MSVHKNKFGAHIFLWIEKWTSKELWLLDRAKQLGLDCLEIAIGDDVEFDAKAIRKASESLGLEIITSPGGIWPVQADLSDANIDNRKFAMEWHKMWIDQAAESGATAYTGALYSHPGHIDKKRISPDDLKHSAESLHELAEYSKKKNIKIVLEPMSHFRVSLVNTPVQIMDLINKADHENLFVLLDTYHLVTEIRDFNEAVNIMAPRLWGIHACENDRGVPGGGIMPWKTIFEALKRNNYTGNFVLETYNSSIRNGDFAYSRAMFHNVCPDGDAFVKTGTHFIKSNY